MRRSWPCERAHVMLGMLRKSVPKRDCGKALLLVALGDSSHIGRSHNSGTSAWPQQWLRPPRPPATPRDRNNGGRPESLPSEVPRSHTSGTGAACASPLAGATAYCGRIGLHRATLSGSPHLSERRRQRHQASGCRSSGASEVLIEP